MLKYGQPTTQARECLPKQGQLSRSQGHDGDDCVEDTQICPQVCSLQQRPMVKAWTCLRTIFLPVEKQPREPHQQEQPPEQEPLRKLPLFLPEFSLSWVRCLFSMKG